MGVFAFGFRLLLEAAGMRPMPVLFSTAAFGVIVYAALLWRMNPPALSDLARLVAPGRKWLASASPAADDL